MATLKQIEANRLNAQKSTGPRSVTGKAASSRNALKSGIDAKALVITGEKAADLEALTAEYLDQYQPANPTERAFVDILIRDDWQLRRLARADAQIWEHRPETMYSLDEDNRFGHIYESGKAVFERLQRRINAVERSFKQALHELERLQANRPPCGADPRPAQPIRPIPPQVQENQPLAPVIGFVPPAPTEPSGSNLRRNDIMKGHVPACS